jgi:hypothetical protein
LALPPGCDFYLTALGISSLMRATGIFIVIAGLFAGYLFALVLPSEWGWENNWLENIQTAVLLAGLLLSVYRYGKEANMRYACLWLAAIPVWFIFVIRELSWGAVFFEPLFIDPVTGPTFSSSRQVPWKPLVSPVLVILLLFSSLLSVKANLYQLLAEQWRRGDFPLIEILLCLTGVFLSNEAEGHGLFGFASFGEGELQLMEEWSEVWAYAALLMAQWHFFRRLKVHPGG